MNEINYLDRHYVCVSVASLNYVLVTMFRIFLLALPFAFGCSPFIWMV